MLASFDPFVVVAYCIAAFVMWGRVTGLLAWHWWCRENDSYLSYRERYGENDSTRRRPSHPDITMWGIAGVVGVLAGVIWPLVMETLRDSP